MLHASKAVSQLSAEVTYWSFMHILVFSIPDYTKIETKFKIIMDGVDVLTHILPLVSLLRCRWMCFVYTKTDTLYELDVEDAFI